MAAGMVSGGLRCLFEALALTPIQAKLGAPADGLVDAAEGLALRRWAGSVNLWSARRVAG